MVLASRDSPFTSFQIILFGAILVLLPLVFFLLMCVYSKILKYKLEQEQQRRDEAEQLERRDIRVAARRRDHDDDFNEDFESESKSLQSGSSLPSYDSVMKKSDLNQ